MDAWTILVSLFLGAYIIFIVNRIVALDAATPANKVEKEKEPVTKKNETETESKAEEKESASKDKTKEKDKKKDKKEEEVAPEVEAKAKQENLDCCDEGCSDPWADVPSSLANKIYWGEMADSVKPYKRHFLLCSGQVDTRWKKKLEDVEGSYVQKASQLFKAKKKKFGYNVKLSVTDLPPKDSTIEEMSPDVTDIIVLPDNLRLLNVTCDTFEATVDELLANPPCPTSEFTGLSTCKFEVLEQEHHFLVCTHKLRDKRCSVVGGMIVDKLEEEIANRNLASSVAVLRVSHVGGHKFAGNVLAYPKGHWFGRVTAHHVNTLMDHVLAVPGAKYLNDHPLSRGAMDTSW